MGKFKDLTGLKFGRLTVIERAGKDKHGKALWHCICDCGDTSITRSDALSSGRSKSCGCLHKEIMSSVKTIHGYRSIKKPVHPLYTAWLNIKNRCLKTNSKDFKYYGGRGITVWPKWKTSPENFITWCCSNGWEKGLEIDRIDNDKGYCPDNCRWTTRIENSQNKRLLYKNNISGYAGVSRVNNKYRSQFSFNKKRYHIGTFKDAVTAAIARDLTCLLLKAKTPLNFPELKNAIR